MGAKLGRNQWHWLRAISTMPNGKFYFGCGHIWTTPSETTQLCETLAKRGLLKVIGEKPSSYGRDRRIWQITDEGRKAVQLRT